MDTGGKRDEHGSALAISSTAEGFEVRLRMFLCQANPFPFILFIFLLLTFQIHILKQRGKYGKG